MDTNLELLHYEPPIPAAKSSLTGASRRNKQDSSKPASLWTTQRCRRLLRSFELALRASKTTKRAQDEGLRNQVLVDRPIGEAVRPSVKRRYGRCSSKQSSARHAGVYNAVVTLDGASRHDGISCNTTETHGKDSGGNSRGSRTGIRDSNTYTSFLGRQYNRILAHTEASIRSNVTESKCALTDPRKGVPSLFQLCLEKLPVVALEEQRKVEKEDPEEKRDLAFECYEELENLYESKAGRGWDGLRTITRAHARSRLIDAVLEGSITTAEVRQIFNILWARHETDEAQRFAEIYLKHLEDGTDRVDNSSPTLTDNLTDHLVSVLGLCYCRSIGSFQYRKLRSLLLSGVLTIDWLVRPELDAIWNSIFIKMGSRDPPYLGADAAQLVETVLCLLCGLKPNSRFESGVPKHHQGPPRYQLFIEGTARCGVSYRMLPPELSSKIRNLVSFIYGSLAYMQEASWPAPESLLGKQDSPLDVLLQWICSNAEAVLHGGRLAESDLELGALPDLIIIYCYLQMNGPVDDRLRAFDLLGELCREDESVVGERILTRLGNIVQFQHPSASTPRTYGQFMPVIEDLVPHLLLEKCSHLSGLMLMHNLLAELSQHPQIVKTPEVHLCADLLQLITNSICEGEGFLPSDSKLSQSRSDSHVEPEEWQYEDGLSEWVLADSKPARRAPIHVSRSNSESRELSLRIPEDEGPSCEGLTAITSTDQSQSDGLLSEDHLLGSELSEDGHHKNRQQSRSCTGFVAEDVLSKCTPERPSQTLKRKHDAEKEFEDVDELCMSINRLKRRFDRKHGLSSSPQSGAPTLTVQRLYGHWNSGHTIELEKIVTPSVGLPAPG